MNSASYFYHYSGFKITWCCAASIALLFFTNQAHARDWQLLLVPESAFGETNQQSSASVPPSYRHLETGLTSSLTMSLETLIDKQSVFPNCHLYLCGKKDIATLMKSVRAKAPQVHLLALYSFGGEADPNVYVRLLDPLSYKIQFSDSLALLDVFSDLNLVALGQDLGKLIESRLAELQPQNEFVVSFEKFLFEELNGLTTRILANSGNTQLRLSESNVEYLFFDQYFAITNNLYQLSTSLNASQLKQLLLAYFKDKGINTTIHFSQQETKGMQFIVLRSGNPYIPSLITVVLLSLGLVVLVTLYIRRQYLENELKECDKKRNADRWLNTYEKGSFMLYGLEKKWASRASYWTRLQHESAQLGQQAQLYFDAGDVHTAKLFVSKSLHANTANPQANKLIKAIETLALSEESLSQSEQWIRNKLAKAMNNYRQKQAIKALKQLYQAAAVAEQESALKKQAQAIKKLIKQINKEFGASEKALVVTCSSDPQSLLLCQNETIHIGRRPNNNDLAWISTQDSVFYINHKSVSRVGQQCFIKRQKDGFYLVDSDSKNGTFLNHKPLTPHQPIKLNKDDTVNIGGSTPFLSSTLNVILKPNESVLEMSMDMQVMTMLDKQELNRVWPDNALAQRTRLVSLYDECCLALHKNTQKIGVFEINELPIKNAANEKKSLNKMTPLEGLNEDTKQNNDALWQPLCIIKLGNKASIRPLLSSNSEHELRVDSMPLLGEVPLIFPCSITYSTISIQLTPYDSINIAYPQGPFVPSTSIDNAQ